MEHKKFTKQDFSMLAVVFTLVVFIIAGFIL